MRHFFVLFIPALIGVGFLGRAQDPLRFQKEVFDIQRKYDSLWDASKETIVFTGSSSIRLWEDLEKSFPEFQIVNSGFGGSQASDLLVYTDELILKYNPKKVFIYEGDNDLADRKSPRQIIADINRIIEKIKQNNNNTVVVLIAAKPSIQRWKLRGRYKRLNRKFERLSRKDPYLQFANIWDVMLEKRKVSGHIFIEDGLHMNDKGYELWYSVIKNYVGR